jgi:hypothetical protein
MLNKRRYRRYFEADDFSKDYPAIDALQDLLDIAEGYDELNYKLSQWFEKYDKVSNDLYFSIYEVLEHKYGEVPLMLRQTRSVDEELENENSLRENFDEIITNFNGKLRKRM